MFGAGVSAGLGAARTAGNVGAGYGAQSADVNSQLFPFLTRELNNPQGYTQQQQNQMLTSAMGGAGGTTAGLTTEANLAEARNRNSGGLSGSLDQIAREREKAAAGTSEGIAAKNAGLQQEQQQNAAQGLSGMEKMDTDAQLKAMGLVPEDINAATKADEAPAGGWMGDLNNIAGAVTNIGKVATGFKIPGFNF